uniref:Uncharacterized protein n=1 Tax=Physcomitrium patens TaxID=3218 RepID=A0A2K1J971_PHYPA|nr:hypothetical protein PHYPA_021191 [Physcomitrium patens]
MVINKLVQGSAILWLANPYIDIVNRHLAMMSHIICCHSSVVHRFFNEGVS